MENCDFKVLPEKLNMKLLLAERNNTSAGLKAGDSDGQYFSGNKKVDGTPWYLEEDEEYNLLLNMDDSIKGGTKEACARFREPDKKSPELKHYCILDNW